jgi:isopenicillin N synthase-like dioxygenase
MYRLNFPARRGFRYAGMDVTDRAEWLTIIHECGEAALEVEIDNRMVPVPPKPNHVIVIFGQPLEDCSAKAFKAGRHQVVVGHVSKY